MEGHLNVNANEYDEAIRRFVPYYDELIETGVTLLSQFVPNNAKILDLGGGTGSLTSAILRSMPGVRITLIDVDRKMLDRARERLASEVSRVDFVEQSFLDPLQQSDAVVASLSLHHIHDLEQKTEAYRNIAAALNAGGIFLNLDAVVSTDSKIAELTFDHWVAKMEEGGMSQEEARGHLKSWELEDRYFSIHEELDALSGAGFVHPECFWRRGPMGIYGGTVDERQ